MKNLKKYRDQLVILNRQMFKILNERKKIVKKIVTIKKRVPKKGEWRNFDPEREIMLYQEIKKDLRRLSAKELLFFSLIIEEHAISSSSKRDYPEWSNGAHLRVSSDSLYDLINPVILLVVKPTIFKRLKLKHKMRQKILDSL